jgi:hypothetical protein
MPLFIDDSVLCCSSRLIDTPSENVSDDASGATARCNVSIDSSTSIDTIVDKTTLVVADFNDTSKNVT